MDKAGIHGTAYGVVETNLRYFDITAFPMTLKEAREKLSNPPAIPSGELEGKSIRFTGGEKYEVYSGPGEFYERMANGKAMVSTNDWIQVFGSENGYILIQYDISSKQMRFGYITQTALPGGVTVSPMHFSYEEAEILADTFLTDDPLGSQGAARSLTPGQSSVQWLAQMGNWVYVEITGDGLPIRGFVPAVAIRKKSLTKTYAGSFVNETYAAQATVEIVGSNCDLSILVSGPEAWKTSASDAIIGYQVYANQAVQPIHATRILLTGTTNWQASFVADGDLPTDTVLLGLCPIYAQTGLHTDEMILINL